VIGRAVALVTCVLVLATSPLRAEEIVLGLSADEVGITATFDGSDILVFGAIKRDAPIPSGSALDVIVAVTGPLTPVTMRKKDRRFGIWINSEVALIDAAPSFYAVATTGPLPEILRDTEDLRHSITIPRAIRSIGNEVTDSAAFTEALIRIRTDEGLYSLLEGAVDLTEQTLFRSRIALPANLTEGRYDARIFLVRDGAVIDVFEAPILVRKVGLERWLFNLAQSQPLAYGLLTLVIAVLLGWMASVTFQRLRR
jgi:uncharacterized protein (TIGR02186 family)